MASTPTKTPTMDPGVSQSGLERAGFGRPILDLTSEASAPPAAANKKLTKAGLSRIALASVILGVASKNPNIMRLPKSP